MSAPRSLALRCRITDTTRALGEGALRTSTPGVDPQPLALQAEVAGAADAALASAALNIAIDPFLSMVVTPIDWIRH